MVSFVLAAPFVIVPSPEVYVYQTITRRGYWTFGIKAIANLPVFAQKISKIWIGEKAVAKSSIFDEIQLYNEWIHVRMQSIEIFRINVPKNVKINLLLWLKQIHLNILTNYQNWKM